MSSAEIYHQSWAAVLAKCQLKLERNDYTRALAIKTPENFRTALGQMYDENQEEASREVIMLLYPVIDHYESFAKSFVAMMAVSVDVSMMWGLLFLVVKVCCEILL